MYQKNCKFKDNEVKALRHVLGQLRECRSGPWIRDPPVPDRDQANNAQYDNCHHDLYPEGEFPRPKYGDWNSCDCNDYQLKCTDKDLGRLPNAVQPMRKSLREKRQRCKKGFFESPVECVAYRADFTVPSNKSPEIWSCRACIDSLAHNVLFSVERRYFVKL